MLKWKGSESAKLKARFFPSFPHFFLEHEHIWNTTLSEPPAEAGQDKG
jgi:hypothetical protein